MATPRKPDQQPVPWIETLVDRSHGRRIVSHLYHDHWQRVRLARAMAEHAMSYLTVHPTGYALTHR